MALAWQLPVEVLEDEFSSADLQAVNDEPNDLFVYPQMNCVPN